MTTRDVWIEWPLGTDVEGSDYSRGQGTSGAEAGGSGTCGRGPRSKAAS